MQNFKQLIQQSTLRNLNKNITLSGYLVREKDPIIINVGLKKSVLFDPSKYNAKFEHNDNILFTLDNKYQPKYSEQLEAKKRNNLIWKELNYRYKTGQFVEGRILNAIKGGYSVGIGGIIAFLPQSHTLKTRSTNSLIGILKTFSLLKVDSIAQNIIVSRKRAIQLWAKKFPTYARTISKSKSNGRR